MGNKSVSLSFQARMKCGWGSKHGGHMDICRWFMGMCWANKESKALNDTDSKGKLGPGRMTVIVQIVRKQSELTVNLHPLWRQLGIQSVKNNLPSTFFVEEIFWRWGNNTWFSHCCVLSFFKSIPSVWILVTHKYATYSLMRFSLVSAIVLLRALNPWGIPGDTLVTVSEPTNQCTDT